MCYLKENRLTAFLILCIIMIFLEASVFNLRHWSTRFNEAVNSQAFDYSSTGLVHQADEFRAVYTRAELTLYGINRPIRTVYIRPQFADTNIRTAQFTIIYRDENNIAGYTATIVNGYVPSFYVPIGAMGNVENITIRFYHPHVGVQAIYFNKALPWTFSYIRFFVLTFWLL